MVRRTDNVGLAIEDLDACITFFTELGLALEGRIPIEGEWAQSVIHLDIHRFGRTPGSLLVDAARAG